MIFYTKLELDWDTLRKNIQEKGLRNSTLTALMPCESSSQISNSTNGIEPPRGFISVKQSKDGILKQVVPEYEKLHKKYELLWDIKDNEGYLQLCAIMQKFVDQSISTNTHYDPSQYDGNRVPMKLFLMDLLKAYKYGIKTLYYHTTRDGASDDQSVEKKGDDDCEDGVCKL
jgi:ribonucleoside-diphosphate reductase alpha chain